MIKKKSPKSQGRKTILGKWLKALLHIQHINGMPVLDQGSLKKGLLKQMGTNLKDFSRDVDQDKDLRFRITERTTDYH